MPTDARTTTTTTVVIVFVALCQIVCAAQALRDVSPDGTYDFMPATTARR